MTECLCAIVTPVENGKLGTCGQLLPHGRARVSHLETGEDLLPGEKGELLLHNPWVNY